MSFTAPRSPHLPGRARPPAEPPRRDPTKSRHGSAGTPRPTSLIAAALVGVIVTAFLVTPEVAAPPSSPTAPPVVSNTSLPFTPTVTFAAPAPAAVDPTRTASRTELLALLREQLATRVPAEEILALLREIGASRPELALDLAQVLGRTDTEKIWWVTTVARDWVRHAPHTSWQWLNVMGDDLEKFADGSLLHVAVDEIAQRDPDLLLANADAAIRNHDALSRLSPQIVAQASLEALIAHGGLDRALAKIEKWTHDPTAGTVGLGAIASVLRPLAQASDVDAANWIQALPPSPERNAAFGVLAADWVARDPAAAMQWSETIPPDAGRAEVLQRAFGEWLELNSLQAGYWLGERLAPGKSGPDLEPLILNLIHQSALIRTAPATALHWAGLIADPDQRSRATEFVLLRWGSRDAPAAIAHVSSVATFSSEQKQALVQKLHAQQSSPDQADVWFASDHFAP